MSKLVDDVKTGLKGIKGAGDTIRGNALEATDDAFDNNRHPATQAKKQEHRAVAEKGKHDVRGVDAMMARREWEREGVHQARAQEGTAGTTHGHAGGVAAPGQQQYTEGSHVPGASQAPATNAPSAGSIGGSNAPGSYETGSGASGSGTTGYGQERPY